MWCGVMPWRGVKKRCAERNKGVGQTKYIFSDIPVHTERKYFIAVTQRK